jgi:protein-L-isoaspartate(D-aspartate) O-methyltransferase
MCPASLHDNYFRLRGLAWRPVCAILHPVPEDRAMAVSIEDIRAFYASELRFTTLMQSRRLEAAFAKVPREAFVGPGPWRIKSFWDFEKYWTTENADSRHVYHDVLIALDEARGINNGQPSLWAFVFDKLDIREGEEVVHLGCGTGYYTAIMAELTGPSGKVTAVDLEEPLVERARDALAPWPQVSVRQADGAAIALPPADVIVASAGATHPQRAWLDAVKIDGRLLFPLMVTDGPGGMLLATRKTPDVFEARFLTPAAFIGFSGARDEEMSSRLLQAFKRDRGADVRSIRCDAHGQDETCWLHGEGWCLSMKEVGKQR